MKLVLKFGGTSVADSARYRGSARLVRDLSASHRIAVVVSAMDGITEELLALADAAGADNRPSISARLTAVKTRHLDAARALQAPALLAPELERLDRLVLGITSVGELTPRSRDAVVAFGEQLSAPLMARALELEGLKARPFTGQQAGLVTDDRFGEAEPLMELSLYQIADQMGGPIEAGEIPVITGFIGATQRGITTTLGRGGSDYSATIVGAALRADEIWIWSDVDGLMSADPRIVPGSRLLERITFGEGIEMGMFGAKSMHPRALEPAAERRIPVRMKNTFRPESPGTLIAPEAAVSGSPARAVLLVRDAGLITVTGAAMIGRPGTAARLFQALGDQGVNIRMISQSVSESGISLAIGGTQVERARAAIEATLLRTGTARHVHVEKEVSIVAVVGAGMKGVPGVAGRVFSAVALKGINIIAIAQGSSELSISFIVKASDGPEAVRLLHDTLITPA